jgi:hypothetical protein
MHRTRNQFHLFQYAVVGSRDRSPRAGVSRDAFAAMQLGFLLMEEGYAPGDTFLNFPEFPYYEGTRPESEYHELDASFAKPGDYWVPAIRPPVHDNVDWTAKRVPRGETTLELMMYAFWRQFFERCGRQQVCLTTDVAKDLVEGAEGYRVMEFQLQRGCNVKQLHGAVHGATPSEHERGSVAFFVRTDAIAPGAPGLFAAFGMDANSTAAWTWLLRTTELRELTRRRGFFMVRLKTPEQPRYRGAYSSIAADYSAELILEHKFENEVA